MRAVLPPSKLVQITSSSNRKLLLFNFSVFFVREIRNPTTYLQTDCIQPLLIPTNDVLTTKIKFLTTDNAQTELTAEIF